jgi:hypothetical protein
VSQTELSKVGIFFKNNEAVNQIRMCKVCVAEKKKMRKQRYMFPFCLVALPMGSCPERYHSHMTLAHNLLTVHKKSEANMPM